MEEWVLPERWSRDWLLDRTPAFPSVERVEATPLERVLLERVLLERAELPEPLERVTLPLRLLLLCWLLLLTPLERVVLPDRAELPDPLDPLERVALPLRLLLLCWLLLLTPVERVAEVEEPPVPLERLTEELPLEREVELLPEERVMLLEREVELLPEERELLLCWVVLPPLERRVWARISGAMSMARASIMEAANVINLLIALKFLS